jgi:hypothetical protein
MSAHSEDDNIQGKSSKKMLVTVIAVAPIIFWIVWLLG